MALFISDERTAFGVQVTWAPPLFTGVLEGIVLITVSMHTHTHARTRGSNGPYELASHRAIGRSLFAQSVLAAAEETSLISRFVPLLVSYSSCCHVSSALLDTFRAVPPTNSTHRFSHFIVKLGQEQISFAYGFA